MFFTRGTAAIRARRVPINYLLAYMARVHDDRNVVLHQFNPLVIH